MSNENASVGDGLSEPEKVSMAVALPIFWRRAERTVVQATEGMYKLGHAYEVASAAVLVAFGEMAEQARREHAQFDG